MEPESGMPPRDMSYDATLQDKKLMQAGPPKSDPSADDVKIEQAVNPAKQQFKSRPSSPRVRKDSISISNASGISQEEAIRQISYTATKILTPEDGDLHDHDGVDAASVTTHESDALKPIIKAKIPIDSAKTVLQWIKDNQDALKTRKGRVAYPETLEFIQQAFTSFETDFGCNWHALKAECKDMRIVQVVNDFRSQILDKQVFSPVQEKFDKDLLHLLEPFSDKLKHDFPHILIIRSFGSTNPTSDCDASFSLKEPFDVMRREFFEVSDELNAKRSADAPESELKPLEEKKAVMEKNLSKLMGMMETLEGKAVGLANNLSTKFSNGAPWAAFLDSNFYPRHFTARADHADFESTRGNLQHQFSLLMMAKTDPKSWSAFTEQLHESFEIRKQNLKEQISNTPSTEERDALNQELKRTLTQQEKVDTDILWVNKNHTEQTNRVNLKIVQLSLADAHKSTGLGQYSSINFNDLDEDDITTLAEAAQKIITEDPHVEILASDLLSVEFATSYEEIENQHHALFFELLHLDEIVERKPRTLQQHMDQVKAFTVAYNDTIERMIKHLKNRLSTETNEAVREVLEDHIQDLKGDPSKGISSKKLDFTTDPTKNIQIMETFKERRRLEKRERSLDEAKKVLETVLLPLNILNSKISDKNNSPQQIQLLESERKSLYADIHRKLERNFRNDPVSNDLKNHVEALHSNISTELETTKQNISQRQANALWDKMGCISLEKDRLFIEMQQAHLVSTAFSREAHIAEGAYGYVVENLQAKSKEVRSLNQLVQAFFEISAFNFAHGSHLPTPATKLIETSKYVDRLMTCIEEMNARAKALGVSAPPVDQNNVKNLKAFFKEILNSRGDASKDNAQKTSDAETSAKASFGKALDQPLVDEINNQVLSMQVALKMWYEALPSDKMNAFYA